MNSFFGLTILAALPVILCGGYDSKQSPPEQKGAKDGLDQLLAEYQRLRLASAT